MEDGKKATKPKGRKKNLDYRNAVFKCLLDHKGALWVNMISELTGIPAKTVTNILDEFYSKGMITDHDIARETNGRVKFRLVSLNPDFLTGKKKEDKDKESLI